VFARKRANMRLHPLFVKTTFQRVPPYGGTPLEKA
jgi:hypothetical protein